MDATVAETVEGETAEEETVEVEMAEERVVDWVEAMAAERAVD